MNRNQIGEANPSAVRALAPSPNTIRMANAPGAPDKAAEAVMREEEVTRRAERVAQLSKDQPHDDHASHDQQNERQEERRISALCDFVHNVSAHAAVRGLRDMADACARRLTSV
jgi:hypothetical protein